MKTRLASSILAAAACCLTLSPAMAQTDVQRVGEDANALAYRKVIDTLSPSLVTVKFAVRMEGLDDAQQEEVMGVIVDASGLVLVSNAKTGGMAIKMGRPISLDDIKIMQGEDTEGFKGRVVARDSDLDLAWIQIDDEKAKGKTFAAMDMTKNAKVGLGERILFVDRMGKFFDRAIVIEEGRIGGETKKPRPVLFYTGISDRRAQGAMGIPVFSAGGQFIGVPVAQLPGKEDMEGGGEMGGGNAAIVILPAAEVVKATARGKEMAAQAPKEEPKADAKPGDEKKPEGDAAKKDDGATKKD